MLASPLTTAASLSQRQALAAVKPPRQRRHSGVARALSLPVKGPGQPFAQLDSDEGDDDDDDDDDGLFWPDSSLQLYLDSADTRSWRRWADTGLFYGFTTNPTILKRDKVQCTPSSLKQLAAEAFSCGAAELQLQAWGRTAGQLADVGKKLFDIDDRIVVKVPITLEGVKAAKVLDEEDVPFTLTGIYAPHQVVTALACGASYAAPYLGRMNDAGKQGFEAIVKMQDIISLDDSDEGCMRLLVASIRSADEIANLAAEGCNTFTISPAVADMLFGEDLTNKAAEAFQQDAEEMGAK
ncbi:hypothetical protein N2152v2_006183 [Parachlorella kessleri]